MISVVICTYNRESILREMLTSFYRQRDLGVIEHEVIVVDNNSSDQTAEAVRSFSGPPAPRYIFEPVQGLSRARNRGVGESRGDIIAFLDDDVIVEAGWLGGIKKCFYETGADVVGGKSTLLFRGPVPDWLGPGFRVNLAQVDLGENRHDVHTAMTLFGVNISFRKSTLLQHGGFFEGVGRIGKQLLSGEETLLLDHILRSGGRVVYEPGAAVQHIIGPERLCWEYFERLAVGEGLSQAAMEKYRGRWVAFLRVIRAMQRLTMVVFKMIVLSSTRSDEYTLRDCQRRRIIRKSLLRGRWFRLWRSKSDAVGTWE